MGKELLLVLSKKAGGMYLSDLKYVADISRVKSELEQLPTHDFPLEQWSDAVKYLTGQDKTFDSAIEYKELLITAEFIKSQRA